VASRGRVQDPPLRRSSGRGVPRPYLTGTVQKAYDPGWAIKPQGISYSTHCVVVSYAEAAQPVVQQQRKER